MYPAEFPLPPCPECGAEVIRYDMDRGLPRGRPAFYSTQRMELVPCGHEVAGYEITVKWMPLVDQSVVMDSSAAPDHPGV